MRFTEVFVFVIIDLTFASISDAYPANSDGGWCNTSNPCGPEMVCIGNKCFNIATITAKYGPVKTTSDGAWCDSDSSNSCGQEAVCINHKCFDVQKIVAKYGPTKTNSDGGWCDLSSPCAENMLCLSNECIDRNRDWGSTISDQGANDNQIQYYQRIKPIDMDPNSFLTNYTTKPPQVTHE